MCEVCIYLLTMCCLYYVVNGACGVPWAGVGPMSVLVVSLGRVDVPVGVVVCCSGLGRNAGLVPGRVGYGASRSGGAGWVGLCGYDAVVMAWWGRC